MATPQTSETGKHKGLTKAPARDLAGAPDVRERLQRVEQLQAAGKTHEAVQEMLAVAGLYTSRSVPVKAVAVLRQAVRLQPDNPDVRMAYGEVLQQLRMVEDAAREYATACAQLETSGRYSEWLEVLRRLLAMDGDNLVGRLQLAEALSRAGKRQEAIDAFRSLAELLLERGETEDWEQVAERLLFHDPSDVTAAHDLALHYVRSGRHAQALSKLILCHDAEPADAELLELIIDTLESLGQREKAAVLCRELVRTFRRTGLGEEANRALERLHSLDPDDDEARIFMGVLKPTVAIDTVIELEPGAVGNVRRDSRRREAARAQSDDAHLQSDDFGEAPTSYVAQLPRPTYNPDGRGQPPATRPSAPSRPVSPEAQPAPAAAVSQGQRRPTAVAGSQTQPSPLPPQAKLGTAPAPVSAAASASAPASVSASGRPASTGHPHMAPAPSVAAGGQPTAGLSRPSSSVRPLAGGVAASLTGSGRTSMPIPVSSAAGEARRPGGQLPAAPTTQPNAQLSDWDGPTSRTSLAAPKADKPGGGVQPVSRPSGPLHRVASGGYRPPQPVPALEALASSYDDADDEVQPGFSEEDEHGFEVEEHTLQHVPTFRLGAAGGVGLGSDAPGLELMRPEPRHEAARPEAPALNPGLADSSGEPIASTRRRSNSLPRPRLARRVGGATELPSTLRDMSKDLGTLEFFIERGFYESAVALLEALQKRHPDSLELQAYRQRIERMPRN